VHVDQRRHLGLTESSGSTGDLAVPGTKPQQRSVPNAVRRMAAAFLILCTAIFLLTAPGRILFPDDEIVFQTTQSLWDDGDLAIAGIPKRTGEPQAEPDGTFGWAEGVDGRRYGFFGLGLSVVAVPVYAFADLTFERVPPSWTHAIRSDHFFMHQRSPHGDWMRMVTSLTNCGVTALAAWMLVLWLATLGYSARASVLTGLAYALGTTAWPYAGTFLSEPLSALTLLASAFAIAKYHHARPNPVGARWLWLAAALGGLSVHVHILNIVAAPCLAAYAVWPIHRERAWGRERKTWGVALAIAAAAVVALALGQWLRFGDPFETGRHGLYSHFIVPGEGLVAILVSPGRSLFLYSPPLLVALVGWRHAWRKTPVAAAFALALIVTRLLFVACRSDWWGGWAVGPRFLVPIVGFGLVGLAALFDDLRSRRGWAVVLVSLAACAALQAHLATYSIFEWTLHLYRTTPEAVGYLHRSHWEWAASPIVGFTTLQPDTLSMGAVRLAQVGHGSLAAVFGAIGAAGLAAAVWLGRRLAALHPEP
jgi:hypothetical protein